MKPVGEFYRNAGCRDGYRPECKNCLLARQKRRREARTEAQRLADSVRATEWARNNREQSRANKTRWRLANHDKQTAAQRSHYARNTEAALASRKRWREANPARTREHVRLARARQSGVAVVPYTDEQLAARVAFFGEKCWMCRVEPFEQMDHVKPIKAGGPHMLSNLRPSCQRCNQSKGSRWPFITRSREKDSLQTRSANLRAQANLAGTGRA